MNIKLIDDYNLETFHDPGNLFPRYDFAGPGVHVFWHRDEKIIMIHEDAMEDKPHRVLKCECDEDEIDMGDMDVINKILVSAYLASKRQDEHPQVKLAIAVFGMSKMDVLELRFSNAEAYHLNKRAFNWEANAKIIDMLEHNRDAYKGMLAMIVFGTIDYDTVMKETNRAVSPFDLNFDDEFFAKYGELAHLTDREKMIIATFEAYYVYVKLCDEIRQWMHEHGGDGNG